MNQSNPVIDAIKIHLDKVLTYESIEIVDETAMHMGHSGYTPGKFHIRIIIDSASLRKLDRITAHRTIYMALGQWLPSVLHAVAIDCR